MAMKQTAMRAVSIVVVCFLIAQCRPSNGVIVTPTWTATTQATENVPDAQPVTSLPSPTENSQLGCVIPPVLISDQNIGEFRWSDSSEQVFYREKDDQIWHSYTITSGQTVPITIEISSTPTDDPQSFGISSVSELYVSPSGKIVVFTRGVPEKQSVYYKFPGEEQEHLLGTIQGKIKKVDWLANEEGALIAMDWQAPIGIPEAYVYAINFSSEELTIEMPKMNDYKNIGYLGLTPDENRIMFVSYLNEVHLDRTVKLWNISTNQIISTPIFNPRDFVWVSPSVLMSAGPQNADSSSQLSVLLYDIDTLKLTYLAEEKYTFAPFLPDAVQISPGGGAIAYIENETNHLYWAICHY